MKNAAKYKPFGKIPLENRQWPDKEITHPPIWCSVDLRDGNQALAIPMGIQQKLAYFDLLVKIGFKEIEVGFPSASQTEYDFLRRLIDDNRIPDDVTIQVLCQARQHLVEKTFQCLKGVKKAIFHIYNSTSPAQRKYTFNKTKEEIIDIAVEGVKCVKSCMPMVEGTDITLEYSPESFSSTEIDFSVEICEAVKKEWQPTPQNKIIFNLPTTVECATPNIHADQIEYFSTHISDRDSVIVSLHNHNDRGEGVASCELALLAGADRVEGTLFGNGERTGNLDITTVALNMFSQGVDPQLDLSNIGEIATLYTKLTGMPIHPRHPVWLPEKTCRKMLYGMCPTYLLILTISVGNTKKLSVSTVRAGKVVLLGFWNKIMGSICLKQCILPWEPLLLLWQTVYSVKSHLKKSLTYSKNSGLQKMLL